MSRSSHRSSAPRVPARQAQAGPHAAGAAWQSRYRAARALEDQGKTAEAITLLERVVAEAPEEYVPRHDLAVLYRQKGRLGDALREFNEVFTRWPNNSTAANDVAGVLCQIGHQPLAFASVERALALDPTNVAAMHNLAEILKHMGDVAAARDVYAAALALAPDEHRARMQYGMVRVALGEWREGWADMESRAAAIGTKVLYKALPDSPRWTGKEEIAGKRLLIVHEQGLGDSIMCARFAAILADRGAIVHLQTLEPLVPLLRTARGVAECTVDGSGFPPHDLHVPLMSLMHVLEVTPDTIDGAAYLTPEGDCPPHIAALLPHDGVPTVAITWAGNPDHGNDHRRSIKGAALAPLLQLPGVRFVAMQKMPRMTDVLPAELHERMTDIGTHCSTFNDSAHALRRADLVITVDTSVAHLAGAVGSRTFLCVPFCPDYRWGVSGTRTPWYDSMTLHRQPDTNGWDAVIADVTSGVRALAAGTMPARS